jgi:hypothetical protein
MLLCGPEILQLATLSQPFGKRSRPSNKRVKDLLNVLQHATPVGTAPKQVPPLGLKPSVGMTGWGNEALDHDDNAFGIS